MINKIKEVVRNEFRNGPIWTYLTVLTTGYPKYTMGDTVYVIDEERQHSDPGLDYTGEIISVDCYRGKYG